MTSASAINIPKRAHPERRPRPAALVVTAGDVEILKHVFEHRFLRRDQLSQLLMRHEKRIHRRLLKLGRHGYLSVRRFPLQKYIYGLGRQGVEVLIEEGIASASLRKDRLRTHELKELFLKHESMIVDIHVLLTVASRQSPVRLLEWREGRSIHDPVRSSNRKEDRLPIRPDALFGLQNARGSHSASTVHFALEADRSTTTQTRFAQKLRAYWHYIEQGRHEKNFGAKAIRVLSVTLTDARARHLCAVAATAIPDRGRKYFLFTSIKKLAHGESNPFYDATCYSARTPNSDECYSLIVAPNLLHKEPLVLERG